ncbi:MAG: hypothetical protein PHQ52_02000 [Candidatus Omnitrophica bacterium]|nr:hypothetical protein [Candidatus Omnitrophota bacterium]
MYIFLIIISLTFICGLFCFLVLKNNKVEHENKRLKLDLSSANRQQAEKEMENDSMRKQLMEIRKTEDSVREEVTQAFRKKEKEYKQKFEEVQIELEKVKRQNIAIERKKTSDIDNISVSSMDKLKQGMYGMRNIEKNDAAEVIESNKVIDDMNKRFEIERNALKKQIDAIKQENEALKNDHVRLENDTKKQEETLPEKQIDKGSIEENQDNNININIELDTGENNNE